MADEQKAIDDGGQDAAAGENSQEQGGELQGASILTKPDEQDDGKDKAKEQDAKKDDPADNVPDKPDGYDLKFGKETQVDAELLAGFRKTAHELGISRGQAQKLAAMYEASAAKAGEKMRAEQRQVMDDARTRWEEEIQRSPSFARERDHARSALRQYGDAELYDLLDQTNLGSHPRMWAFLAKVGKALAEPGFHGKSAGSQDKSAAEVLYPNQGK